MRCLGVVSAACLALLTLGAPGPAFAAERGPVAGPVPVADSAAGPGTRRMEAPGAGDRAALAVGCGSDAAGIAATVNTLQREQAPAGFFRFPFGTRGGTPIAAALGCPPGPDGLPALLAALRADGYDVTGPYPLPTAHGADGDGPTHPTGHPGASGTTDPSGTTGEDPREVEREREGDAPVRPVTAEVAALIKELPLH